MQTDSKWQMRYPKSVMENAHQEYIRGWLRSVLDDAALSPSELAKRAGLADTTLSRFLNQKEFKYTLSARSILKICNALGIANPLTMVKDGITTVDLTVQVPVIDKITAGAMAMISDPLPAGAAEEYVPVSYHRSTLLGLTVDGQSMNRIANNGDVAIFDYADTDLIDGKSYIIRREGEATMKRFRADPPRFEPYSTEPDHPTIFPSATLEVLGKVIFTLRKIG